MSLRALASKMALAASSSARLAASFRALASLRARSRAILARARSFCTSIRSSYVDEAAERYSRRSGGINGVAAGDVSVDDAIGTPDRSRSKESTAPIWTVGVSAISSAPQVLPVLPCRERFDVTMDKAAMIKAWNASAASSEPVSEVAMRTALPTIASRLGLAPPISDVLPTPPLALPFAEGDAKIGWAESASTRTGKTLSAPLLVSSLLLDPDPSS